MTAYYLPAWTGPDSPQSPVPVPVPPPPHCDRCGSSRARLVGAYGGLVCRDVFACWRRYQKGRPAALCLA